MVVEYKPVGTPLIPNEKLAKNTSKNDKSFSRVDALMYFSVCTRSDVNYAISSLSQFNTCYSKEHWITAKSIKLFKGYNKLFSVL